MWCLDPAQNSLDPGQEFFRFKWFLDIVICTEFETDDFVEGVSTGGKHDHRDTGGAADLAQHIVSILTRQHQVENDNIRRSLGENLHRMVAVITSDNLKTVFVKIQPQ